MASKVEGARVPNTLKQEFVEDIRRELDRGVEKVISRKAYPIRWFFLQTFVGMCGILVILFFLAISSLPPLPWSMQFWSVLLIPPVVSLLRFRPFRRAKR